ncbi:MAG: hypothetical protein IJO40_04015 [Thermoguttaceae bacterium]|nr:hypothetical protein [Thermoguttaceae bacterium]
MRLALQALFAAIEANEEGAARRALLERRLRSNERSAGFFRRLRDAVDDDSLQAPEIFAEESFPDANVVAEYLDGQTSSDVARAYESACWDSPEILAEAGRCYDILNNDALNCVVAPKNCRRRLYYIAWEESAVDVSAERKNAAIATDSDCDWSPEAEELTQTLSGERDDVARSTSKAKKEKRPKKAEKKVKSANSIGSTLAAERSFGRRVKRLVSRLGLALGLGGAIYCGWQTLNDDKRSETLDLETPRRESVDVIAASERNSVEETPLRPTTISTLAVDEIPATSLSDSTNVAENEIFGDVAEMEPTKLAALPDALSEGEGIEPRFAGAVDGERSRVGLGGEQPWNRRPSIEIPAQNNDVFTKAKLY